MIELGAVFVGGLLGSSHCIGMCGGLAATLGTGTSSLKRMLARQLVFSAGRVFTYSFMGALAGAAGAYLQRFATPLIGVQQVFSALAGVVMLYVGFSVLGLLPGRAKASPGSGCLIGPLFRQFLSSDRLGGFFTAGLATGFLPCGLVYSFLAMAVSAGSVGYGMALMACFGLGTVPAMVAVGSGSAMLSHTVRAKVFQMAACLVIVMGFASLYRAVPRSEGQACHTPTVQAQPTAPVAQQGP
ncbi:MAG: sulfite exporter TauE/SafE family protein [Phycisphaerae bacterium]